jgi:hypothetical protein
LKIPFSWGLAAFAAWNAITYASLLPLWEGFDEPFHYAYVQHLRTTRQFPVHGETAISEEIWQSLALSPASRIVHQNIPVAIPYDEYFRLPEARRRELRAKLEGLDPALADIETGALNYEAHQSPLAYLLLAPVDGVLHRVSLPRRVWLLRILCGGISAVATVAALLRLSRVLGMAPQWGWLAAFLASSLQMFYATTVHVANDWLAVPLYTIWLGAAVDLARRPNWRRLAVCVAALAAGLLTKAYFLSAVPVMVVVAATVARRLPRTGWARPVVAMVLCVAAAGGWYARNGRLYRSVSGMQEVKGGTPLSTLIDAAGRAPWGLSIDTTVHSMIWTGNNSDTSFNRRTVNAMLALMALGMTRFVVRKDWTAGQAVAIGAVAAFTAALGYSAAIKVFSTGGVAIAPSAWYATPAVIPVFCLVADGFSRLGRAGKAAAIAAASLWAYVIVATWWAKLIPLYAGYPMPQARPAELWRWYSGEGAAIRAFLDTAMIGGGAWTLAGAALAAIGALCAGVFVSRPLVQK